MENQAEKRNGMVVGSFLIPMLKFSYNNLPVLITSVPGSKRHPAKTEVVVTLQKVFPSNVTIYRETVMSHIREQFGSKDIQLGIDAFDREYMIKGDNELFIRNLINSSLQNRLLDFVREKPTVQLQGTWLSVSVPKVIKTEEGYDQLIHTAEVIVDRLQEL